MPKGYPRTACKVCGRTIEDCGGLSRRGKCQTCALTRIESNIVQLSEHRGPWFHHWRERSLAALGVMRTDNNHSET